jgi:hypothetical protein
MGSMNISDDFERTALGSCQWFMVSKRGKIISRVRRRLAEGSSRALGGAFLNAGRCGKSNSIQKED